jgi:hypothetical protein
MDSVANDGRMLRRPRCEAVEHSTILDQHALYDRASPGAAWRCRGSNVVTVQRLVTNVRPPSHACGQDEQVRGGSGPRSSPDDTIAAQRLLPLATVVLAANGARYRSGTYDRHVRHSRRPFVRCVGHGGRTRLDAFGFQIAAHSASGYGCVATRHDRAPPLHSVYRPCSSLRHR